MTDVSQSPAAVAGPPVAQPVLTALTASAIFLVLTIDDGGEPVVHDLLADLSGLARTVGFRSPQGGLAVVAGVGSAAWDRLFAGPRPAELHPFRALDGDRHRAVATPGDLLFHIRAATMDLCWELASLVVGRLAGAATVVDEVHGFKYFDERDLLGFVDGTENPSGPAAEAAVTIGAEDPEFAGGSYVIVQKYLHDMAAWNGLTVEEQERVIGRAKLSNVEMADDVKPSNSHVALNTIVDADGTQRQILRDNMPFGSLGAGEFGTYFIGYAGHPVGHRADAPAHVPRRPSGQLRPDPRLLHRGHRHPVLRAHCGLPRRSSAVAGERPMAQPRTGAERLMLRKRPPPAARPAQTTDRWGSVGSGARRRSSGRDRLSVGGLGTWSDLWGGSWFASASRMRAAEKSASSGGSTPGMSILTLGGMGRRSGASSAH